MGTRDGGFAVAAILLAACASKPAVQARDTLTTRQRQERVGAMPIPGAKGVTRALEVQDSGAARAKLIDSAGSER